MTSAAVREERRRAHAQLKDAEERFRTFFDDAPIGKCMTAPDGRLMRVNPAFGKMLGRTAEEMQRVSFAEITQSNDIAESRAEIIVGELIKASKRVSP